MKRLFLIALVSIFVFAGSVQFSEAAQGDIYVGAKMGLMMIDDEENITNIDDITAIGFLVGVGVAPKVSVEGDLIVGVSGGDVNRGALIKGGDIDIWTLGGYAVYRHPILEKVSLKAKIGFILEWVSVDIDTFLGSYSKDDVDFGSSAGVGGTIEITDQVSVEIEYTIIETDVGYLSAGVNYKF